MVVSVTPIPEVFQRLHATGRSSDSRLIPFSAPSRPDNPASDVIALAVPGYSGGPVSEFNGVPYCAITHLSRKNHSRKPRIRPARKNAAVLHAPFGVSLIRLYRMTFFSLPFPRIYVYDSPLACGGLAPRR